MTISDTVHKINDLALCERFMALSREADKIFDKVFDNDLTAVIYIKGGVLKYPKYI